MKKGFFLITVPLLIAIMLTSTQCNDKEESVMCTSEFVTILLKLEFSDGQPVLLDSSKVFWVSKNRFLEQNLFDANGLRTNGYYGVVNDLMQPELKGKQEIMRFTGYVNDEIICERNVLVGADRCHVMYLGTEPLIQVIDL